MSPPSAPDAPGAPATHPDPASLELPPELRRRMLLYRLIPVIVFFITFGGLLVWEFAVRGSPVTSEKLQALLLLALLFTLLIGAPVGIRWFNPLPAKK